MTAGDEGPLDPLRTRRRPGVEVDPQSATWDSTVFAITAGLSVRYLEVPANEVGPFLDAVDSGKLDDELRALATTPTGAVLNAPHRIRKLAAFDRVVRQAIARVERDTSTGQLAEPGWKPRKRRRDEESRDQGSRHSDHAAQADSGAATGAAPAAPALVSAAIVQPAAKAAWWSTPVVAVGAVTAAVVIAVVAVVLITRSSDDPDTTAGAVTSTSAASSAAPTSDAVTSGETAGVGPVPGADTASAEPSVPESTVALSSVTSVAGSAVDSAGTDAATGPVVPRNPLEGSFALVRTVTDNSGNPAFPIGATDTGTITFTAACAEPTCAISNEGWGTATISGSQIFFSGTATEVCTGDPSISVTDSWTITLQATGLETGTATGLEGTGTLTTSELNGCNADVYPLTQSYVLTRTG